MQIHSHPKPQPLSAASPLVDAVREIESSFRRIAVVVSPSGSLLGTLTDGDVRRCLLNGGNLQTPVSEAMNSQPITSHIGAPTTYLKALFSEHNILAVPLVNDVGKYISVVHKHELDVSASIAPKDHFEFAVIMAGGQGLRLRPITNHIPKPMVDIAGVPLLERQVAMLANAGIPLVYLSVNYMSDVIESHFGNGSSFGVEIQYLRESDSLGTGGALSLLPERPCKPILVMNGDILTTFDIHSLYDFHAASCAKITLAAIYYCVTVPFGVLENDGIFLSHIVEKPTQRYLCNAGIYCLSPVVLDRLPPSDRFNMTDIITQHLQDNDANSVAVFPVHEYWSDIGTPADLDKARTYFTKPSRHT